MPKARPNAQMMRPKARSRLPDMPWKLTSDRFGRTRLASPPPPAASAAGANASRQTATTARKRTVLFQPSAGDLVDLTSMQHASLSAPHGLLTCGVATQERG